MISRFRPDKSPEVSFSPVFENKREYFTELYNRNFGYVYSFVYARTAGDSAMTEEIVQDSFAAAWTALERYRGNSTCETWLCSIAKNKLYENYRRRTAAARLFVTDSELLSEQEADFSVERQILDGETRDRVLDALNKINDLYRYALIMKYLDDLSVKQISKVLGRTPKAVDGILQRARSGFAKEYMRLDGRSTEHG